MFRFSCDCGPIQKYSRYQSEITDIDGEWRLIFINAKGDNHLFWASGIWVGPGLCDVKGNKAYQIKGWIHYGYFADQDYRKHAHRKSEYLTTTAVASAVGVVNINCKTDAWHRGAAVSIISGLPLLSAKAPAIWINAGSRTFLRYWNFQRSMLY